MKITAQSCGTTFRRGPRNTSCRFWRCITVSFIGGILSVSGFVFAQDAETQAIEEAAIEKPLFVTNSAWEQKEFDSDIYSDPFKVSLFSPEHGEDKARLWSQTKSVFGYGLGVVGFIYMLPEDVSNWDKEGEVFSKWGDNVTSGPVWDRDVGWINLIGHPYFGGVYYQVARKSGYRQWDAFIYAATMSTFYWEYGVEAFAEIPAIQDLVITPVMGWVVGEWAFQTEREIRLSGGKVMNSALLGDVSLFFLDPVDSIGRGMNNLFGRQIVQAGTGYMNIVEEPLGDSGETEQRFVIGVSYALGDGSRDIPHYDYHDWTGDPIDTSIIGISMGTGYTNLDSDWQADNGVFGEVSLGLYFTPSFSMALNYARAHLDDLRTGERLTYENYSVNARYYFKTQQALRPYLTGGLGEIMRDQDRDRKTVTTNLGVGMHYQFASKWAVQSELKRYISTRYNTQDDVLSLSVIYRLGDGERR